MGYIYGVDKVVVWDNGLMMDRWVGMLMAMLMSNSLKTV